jgi:hypothetical protein
MLTDDHKKALFIFGTGFLLFWLFKPKVSKLSTNTELRYTDGAEEPKDRNKITMPKVSNKTLKSHPLAQNGMAAMKGYIDAYNNGEPQSVLDELNREFAKEFKVKVYKRKSDGKVVVCDLEGKEIMINNA